MTKELVMKCIGFASQCGDMAAVEELTAILNDILNPVEPKKRKTPDKSGIVQCDIETGAEIARFATIKEANAAIGKKEKSSGISDALNRSNTHVAYGFKWFHVSEFDAQ